MAEKMKSITHNPGRCPHCGEAAVSDGEMKILNKNEVELPLKCTVCHLSFAESYLLQYIGVTVEGDFYDVDDEEEEEAP